MTSILFQLTTVVAILRARQAKHHGELQVHEYGHLLAWLPPGSAFGSPQEASELNLKRQLLTLVL